MPRCAFLSSLLIALFLATSCEDSGTIEAGGTRSEGAIEAEIQIESQTEIEAETEAGGSIFDGLDSALVLRASEPNQGDLDAIYERGTLRVLVSYSRTNFFINKGRLRGFEYEMLRELGEHLGTVAPEGSPPLVITFLPIPFDELIPALLEGRGDVVAASLTITPDRAAQVSFSAPYLEDVQEILVAHEDAPAVSAWSDLSGKEVFVTSGSSYAEHLESINRELVAGGHAPTLVRTMGRGIDVEDLLEMVSSSALPYTVVDRYLGELWAEVLSGLRLHPELTTGPGGELAWAVRPDSPKLKAMLDAFVQENRKGTLIGNVLFKRYHGKTDWLRNPLFDGDNSKLSAFLPDLLELSAQYDFDWRLIAAQAFQESGLDPTAESDAGAIGLMQLLPSTAADMGITDLLDPTENLRAGIKYMNWLRETFFNEPMLDPSVRVDFALAAYNAGPSNVKRWRAAAPERGLDPNLWFGNVELIGLEAIGMQPVQYVSNINKYFVILTLTLDEIRARGTAKGVWAEASAR